MKNIILLIALAINPLLFKNIHFPLDGIEPKKINSKNEISKVEIIPCKDCNMKVYLITIQKNCCKKVVQIVVKNMSSGEFVNREVLILPTDAVLPDGCSFACEYLQVFN